MAGYVIGVRGHVMDSDDLGASGWSKVVLVALSPTCQVTRLYEQYLGRGGGYPKQDIPFGRGYPIESLEWCGGELDFRLIDERKAEIITTIPKSSKQVCEAQANPRERVLRKTTPLKVLQ